VVCIVVAAYIVDPHCFSGVIAVFHIAVVGNIGGHYCLMFDRGVVHIGVAGYIIHHYYFRFDEVWFILLWQAILLTITV
jgi:hypothetical protein